MKKLGDLLFVLYQGYENRDSDLTTNGEEHLMRTLGAQAKLELAFDVGANRGDWTIALKKHAPNSVIHAFELVPQTYERLREQVGNAPRVFLHPFGLSDREEVVTVYAHQNDELNTCIPGFSRTFHHEEPKSVATRVRTGDSFCQEHGIERIDYLKIDTEGYEDRVLAGFKHMLAQERISMIQFEYGYLNVETHFLLKDFYRLLEPFGMHIGKIYPDHVDFTEYSYFQENFFGQNYLAVHRSVFPEIERLIGLRS